MKNKTVLNRNTFISAGGLLLIVAFVSVYAKYQPLSYVRNSQLAIFSEPLGAVSTKTTHLIGDIFNMNTNTQNSNKGSSVFAGAVGLKTCGLTLSISSKTSNPIDGSQMDYFIKVKNEGRQLCKEVSMTTYYSDNHTYVSSTPAGIQGYYWKLGNLAPGASRDIAITTHIDMDISPVVDLESCVTASTGNDVCTHLLLEAGQQSIPTFPAQPFESGSREYGTWVWQSPNVMTDEYMDTVLNGALQYGINTVYVTIDDYLAIHNMTEGITKDKKKADYSASLEKFIKAAHAKGIEVDVEAGWKDWAKESNAYKSEAIIDYVIEYNNTHIEKIRSVQFDVEPYLLSEYESNKSAVLTSFVAFIDKSTTRLVNNNLRFAVVIPHFYDSAQRWTPVVTHNGITTYTFDHLLRILDRKAHSSIILMSYRNFAEGEDGSIRISETEIKTASATTHSTKIIVAQETGAVEPEYVTFNNTSRALYEKQVNLIDQAFKNHSNFGGISVHYIDPFLEL